MYDLGLARIAEFAAQQRIPVTFFAVGADLVRQGAARRLRQAVAEGHIVENHSYSHRYDLTKLPPQHISEEVQRAQQIIEQVVGRRPVGFRAPGYAINDHVLDALVAAGLSYDSSVFPCLPYYGAKAMVMATMWLRGARTIAVLDSPRVLTAPRRPYRPGRPWHRPGQRELVELPVQVTGWLRWPVIGTSLVVAGRLGARWLANRCSGEPLVNLELHGIDFLDESDGLSDLRVVQPDVRVAARQKMTVFATFIERLRQKGYRFVSLEAAAQAVAACDGRAVAPAGARR